VELQQIDAKLAKLAAEKAEVEAELASPQAGDYAELGRRLAHVNAETAMLEERWLELQTRLEAMTG
jgi:ATP-binding cassette subfamily F protein 3